MNLQHLHTLLTKAKELCQHQEYVIVGSLSILGTISQPPREMVMSIDVDTYIKNDPGRTELLQEPLGQGSIFEDKCLAEYSHHRTAHLKRAMP